MFVSKASTYAASPIREDDSIADELKKEGKEVIKLNSGDPPKYFKTYSYVIDAYIEALKANKTFYSDSRGIKELREAISARHKRVYGLDVSPERVLVTQGVSEALYFINTVLIGRGRKAVLFAPYYPSYMPYLRVAGGNAVIADCNEDENWEIDIDELEKRIKENKNIRYMLITNPNNPTGAILPRKTLERLATLANDYGIFPISDEIYDELVFEGKITSFSEVAKGMPYMILNGASKTFDATGFRLGYALVPNDDKKSEELYAKMLDLARMRLSVNTPAQYAYAEGINNINEHDKEVSMFRNEIKERVLYVAEDVNKNGYMHAVTPMSAFYVFPKLDMEKLDFKDDREFTKRLLTEKYVQVTRGSGFGKEGHIRIVSLADKGILSDALNRIADFCERHKK